MLALRTGTHRLFVRGIGFEEGRTYTARLWTPSLVRGEERTLSEISDGLYYIDYDLDEPGGWPVIIYRGDTGAAWSWTVLRVGDVDNTVLDAVVEGSLSLREVQRIALAALAGLVSGASTTELRFRDVADTKDRIVAIVTRDGNRTTIVLDGS